MGLTFVKHVLFEMKLYENFIHDIGAYLVYEAIEPKWKRKYINFTF